MSVERPAPPDTRRSPRRRSALRRHAPFLLFFAAFTAYCAFLQFSMQDALSRLYLVRIFFQVAIAAAVIAAMRNVVGVRMFGMFSSVIIALAFLATGLLLGLVLLGLILGVVLLVRGALIRERVQEAHRVAILVTVVGVTVSSIAIIGLEWAQHSLFFAVLFPVLISAWFAERYVERVTRVGWDDPTKALLWTIAGIVVSFLVITQDPLVNYVMLTPLTWPILVLINWFLGTRVRFRLLERYRFGGVSRYALTDGPIRGDFGDDVLTMNVRNREFVAKAHEGRGEADPDPARDPDGEVVRDPADPRRPRPLHGLDGNPRPLRPEARLGSRRRRDPARPLEREGRVRHERGASIREGHRGTRSRDPRR
jgi:hypothetical protein